MPCVWSAVTLEGMRKSRRRLCSLAVCTIGVAALVAGCGSGGAPSDFCKSVDGMAAAVQQINQTSLTKSSVSAVETSLSVLDGAEKNLSDTVEAEFADETAAVTAALKQLNTTVDAAVDKPTPGNMDAARTSMSTLTTAVNDLDEASSSSC